MSNSLIFLLNNDWIGSTCGLLPSNQWKLDQNSSDFFWTATLNLQHLGTTTNSELVISLYTIYTSCFTVTLNSFYFIFFIYFHFFVHINKQSGSGLSNRSKNILRKLGDFFLLPTVVSPQNVEVECGGCGLPVCGGSTLNHQHIIYWHGQVYTDKLFWDDPELKLRKGKLVHLKVIGFVTSFLQ